MMGADSGKSFMVGRVILAPSDFDLWPSSLLVPVQVGSYRYVLRMSRQTCDGWTGMVHDSGITGLHLLEWKEQDGRHAGEDSFY
jgi:hypothetical protein